MRFVYSAPNATVFYDFDYENFVVKFYRNGVVLPGTDYHTNDQADAFSVAINFKGEPA